MKRETVGERIGKRYGLKRGAVVAINRAVMRAARCAWTMRAQYEYELDAGKMSNMIRIEDKFCDCYRTSSRRRK